VSHYLSCGVAPISTSLTGHNPVVFYQGQIADRVNALVQLVGEPRAHVFSRRPWQATWFATQVAVCLHLWNQDATLNKALELGTKFLIPCDVLDALWQSPRMFTVHDIVLLSLTLVSSPSKPYRLAPPQARERLRHRRRAASSPCRIDPPTGAVVHPGHYAHHRRPLRVRRMSRPSRQLDASRRSTYTTTAQRAVPMRLSHTTLPQKSLKFACLLAHLPTCLLKSRSRYVILAGRPTLAPTHTTLIILALLVRCYPLPSLGTRYGRVRLHTPLLC
jgi:hypothetical protein